MSFKNILFIGGGNMGTAIAEGLLRDENNHIIIKDPAFEKHPFNQLENKDHISLTNDLNQITQKIDVIILAVKPYLIEKILQDKEMIAFLENQSSMVVSVAAGISYDQLRQHTPNHLSVVRSMPNLPVAFGVGSFGYYAPDHNPTFEDIFKICGSVIYFPKEDTLHDFTALAGSGPAYIFHMIEALALAAEKNGMTKDDAYIIAKQTVVGSALLAHHKDLSATILRQNVTSPNGTTQAGLEALMQNTTLDPNHSALTDLLNDTLTAAKNKSIEIASS